MHKQLIKAASDTQIREFVDDALSMIKETNHDLYEELESYLYKELYGCHFNSWLLEKALNDLENEDGTTGGHWSLDQTTSVARAKGISFNQYNEYDFCYVLNLMYSDYFGAVKDDTDTYIQMAIKFLSDKDAPEGKAYKYYIAMH